MVKNSSDRVSIGTESTDAFECGIGFQPVVVGPQAGSRCHHSSGLLHDMVGSFLALTGFHLCFYDEAVSA